MGATTPCGLKRCKNPPTGSLLHLVTLEAGIILRAPTPRRMLASILLLLPTLPMANLSNRYLRSQPRATRLQRPPDPPAAHAGLGRSRPRPSDCRSCKGPVRQARPPTPRPPVALTLAGADKEVAVGGDAAEGQVHHGPRVPGARQRGLPHGHGGG